MKKYLLRISDEEKWREIKAKAALASIPISVLIWNFLEGWLKTPDPPFTRKRPDFVDKEAARDQENA